MNDDKETQLVIRTRDRDWLKQLAVAYKAKQPFTLIDDARIGIDPRQDTLLSMGIHAKLSPREWSGVLIALGIGAVGAWVIVMAVLDPEPYSKVVSTIATGAILLGTGGLLAIRLLTHVKPPNITVLPNGAFMISWD